MDIFVDNSNSIIQLGRQGENNHTKVYFKIYSNWKAELGDGILALAVQRPGEHVPTPIPLIINGDSAHWLISESDVAKTGIGLAQLTYIVNNEKVKSAIYRTKIRKSLDDGGDAPEPVKRWLDEAYTTLNTVSNATVNHPKINGNSNWMIYDPISNEYQDTGICALATDGKSAYQIALDNSYTGTEQEWLASLHGKDGVNAATPDWSVNDETNPAYIKNRPFYKGDSTTTEILAVGEYVIDSYGEAQPPIAFTDAISPGDTLKISWNGTVYKTVAIDYKAFAPELPPEITAVVAGNLGAVDVPGFADTGEPFIMICMFGMIRGEQINHTSFELLSPPAEGQTVTAKIGVKKTTELVEKIPSIFLPLDTITRYVASHLPPAEGGRY